MINTTPAVCEIEGVQRVFDVPLNDVIGEIILRTGKSGEHDELALVSSIMRASRRHGVYVDVGCNIGTHAVAFSHMGADCVLAFDLSAEMLGVFRKNIARNAHRECLTVTFCAALGDGSVCFLAKYHNDLGKTRLCRELSEIDSNAVVTEYDLKTECLDEYVTPGMQSVSLLKIDVEGFEEAVLRGAPKMLEVSRPLVWAECWASDEEKPSRILKLLPAKYRSRQVGESDNWIFYPEEMTSVVNRGFTDFLEKSSKT